MYGMDEPKTKTLKNGAVYDMEKHRITSNPGGGLAAFTSESAKAAQARRQELKRAAVVAGANAAVERNDYKEAYGDLAYVAAIAEVQTNKALTADDPKSTDAARFVFQESGVAEAVTRGADGGPGLPSVPSRVILLLAELASRAEYSGTVLDGEEVGTAAPSLADGSA